MRRLVVSEYLTLDGVFEEPGRWSFDFWSDAAMRFKADELAATGVMLLGRVTYERLAASWPQMTDAMGFADRMNGMPKYVVSTTLKHPTWHNSHVIAADLMDEVARLKRDDAAGDILITGSGSIVRTLMAVGLVDEFRFMVHPVVLGKGRRLFRDGIDRMDFALVDTNLLANGVLVLTYRPANVR